jgi:XisI protein
MDKLEQYRNILRQIIESYAQHKPAHGDIILSPMIDSQNDHYGVLMAGWDNKKRVQGLVIHVDIIDGKIWIQYDGTAPGIAEDLVEAGIPRDDIVLGFQPPEVRQYTDFARG